MTETQSLKIINKEPVFYFAINFIKMNITNNSIDQSYDLQIVYWNTADYLKKLALRYKIFR